MRQAIVTQNETLKAEGKPEVPAKSLVALAEQMLPQIRSAEWRDRADAALADVDEIDLRDLRSVVGADDAAHDEESRAIASQLREALTTRVEKEHSAWLDEIGTALDESRVVHTLRLSTRPPKAGARFPAPLAARLTEATGAALNATATTDRWVAVLEAIAFSPVRSSVVAVSVPDPIPDDLKASVAKSAGALPQIASQFGIEPPAVTGPPKPRRPVPPRRPPKPPSSAGRGRSPGRPRRCPGCVTGRGGSGGCRGSGGGRSCCRRGRTGGGAGSGDRGGSSGRRSSSRRGGPGRRGGSGRRRTSDDRGPTVSRVRLRFPPISLASLRRHGHGRVRHRGRIGIFTLNRPEARNAVNGEVAADMEAAVDRFEDDPEVWVGVITATIVGDRPVFSAGADLKAVNTAAGGGISTRRVASPASRTASAPSPSSPLSMASRLRGVAR